MKCDELKSIDMIVNDDYKTKVYLKDEVDAAIAELKEKLESVQASMYCDVVDAEMDNIRLRRELRHNKYKRCLAMARWCESEAYIHEHGSDYDEDLVAWFGKWHKRWLKLADQFKDAK